MTVLSMNVVFCQIMAKINDSKKYELPDMRRTVSGQS